jgi:hypothetical protein
VRMCNGCVITGKQSVSCSQLTPLPPPPPNSTFHFHARVVQLLNGVSTLKRKYTALVLHDAASPAVQLLDNLHVLRRQMAFEWSAHKY